MAGEMVERVKQAMGEKAASSHANVTFDGQYLNVVGYGTIDVEPLARAAIEAAARALNDEALK